MLAVGERVLEGSACENRKGTQESARGTDRDGCGGIRRCAEVFGVGGGRGTVGI